MNYEGTRSPWSAQERTAISGLEQYVNNSEWKNDEVEECSLGPEHSDVDVKHNLKKCNKGRQI